MTRRVLFFVIATAIMAPAPGVRAEHDPADWSRPFVTEIEVRVKRGGERPREFGKRDRVELGVGESVDFEVRGFDQDGRGFPSDRFLIGVDRDRRCESITIEDLHSDSFRLVATKRRGDCEIELWLPGNLNVSRTIRVEVGGKDTAGYGRGDADFIARALYRAILARDADPEGLSSATAEIQRGRLEEQIESMVASLEFRRRSSSAQGLLDDFYRGLLGREADSNGVRQYLGAIERRRYADVLMKLMLSEEFERKLPGK